MLGEYEMFHRGQGVGRTGGACPVNPEVVVFEDLGQVLELS